ncbi:lysine exporter LysO family protein [Dryocola sp. BD626]|uniref:lysine exporter LysO family protein n=1 Tax=Dryocola sp. BD626 TaxID=3133273 RepID=UPI003F4FDB36
MITALSNLFPILIAFVIGFNMRQVVKNVNITKVNFISNFCLYALLVLMGVTIGLIPGIFDELYSVGLNAISIAVASSLAIAIALKIFHVRTCRESNSSGSEKDTQVSFDITEYVKDPLLLVGLVIIGFIAGYYEIMPGLDYDYLISGLLYLLIFVIAIKLSFSGLSVKTIFLNKNNIVMTLVTVLASYVGAAIASIFISLDLTQSLAVSSGFGWYTLSGILFTKMGNPVLGSVAFLCDLVRELIALLLIPTLSRLGNANIAIGVAGATAMDVTLPIIEKHCGVGYVPVALLSGGIITFIVPFLIPFFYSL